MKKDYTVGYGKPPAGSRFKKGQTGNPNGKQKGVRSLDIELTEELGEKVWVNENGKRKSYSKLRLILKSLVAKAIKGDVRAALAAMKLRLDYPANTGLQGPELNEADRAILDDFLRRHSVKETNDET